MKLSQQMAQDYIAPMPSDIAATRSRVTPPVVLLRASEDVPGHSSFSEGSVEGENKRDKNSLDWNVHRLGLVTKIIPVPGHHFSLFSKINVSSRHTNLNT
jgi:hypothetical protein